MKLRLNTRNVGFGFLALLVVLYILFLPPPSRFYNPHLGLVMLGLIVTKLVSRGRRSAAA